MRHRTTWNCWGCKAPFTVTEWDACGWPASLFCPACQIGETWECDTCGQPTPNPPVEITYRVLDEIHTGHLVTCKDCREAFEDTQEALFDLAEGRA